MSTLRVKRFQVFMYTKLKHISSCYPLPQRIGILLSKLQQEFFEEELILSRQVEKQYFFYRSGIIQYFVQEEEKEITFE